MRQKKTRSQKQKVTLIVCVALFAALLPVYLLFIQPLLSEVAEPELPELLEGEVRDGLHILMFEHIEQATLSSIEVHNEHGSYTFYCTDEKKNTFSIKGMEGAPYVADSFSQLVVDTCYTLVEERLDDAQEDLSVYGLGEKDTPARFTVTKKGKDKISHTVLVGKEYPSGGGYYCMYEGRDAVYVLDSSLASTVLADVYSLISPKLTYPITEGNALMADDFTLVKNGEPFVAFDRLTAKETGKDQDEYVLKYPKGYNPNFNTYATLLLEMGTFSGLKTVACGSDLEALDSAMLKETYGIDVNAPYFLLSYACDDVETRVVFSEPNEEGVMYAYSTLYNLVATVDAASTTFLNWELLRYIDPYVYVKSIDDIAKVAIKGQIRNGEESLDVDALFTLDGEGTDLIVKDQSSAKPYDADGVKNFRQLMKSVIGIKIQDYTEETDVSAMTPLAEITVTDDEGETVALAFYTYSTRRCFYTVDGKGEFYVLRDDVEKVLRDTDRVIKGIRVDSESNL